MIQTSGKQHLESDVNADSIWRGVIKNEELISRDWRHTYGFLDTKPKIELKKKTGNRKKRVNMEDMLMLPNPPQRQGEEIRKRYLFIQERGREIPDRLKNKKKLKKREEFKDTSKSRIVNSILKRSEKKQLKKSRMIERNKPKRIRITKGVRKVEKTDEKEKVSEPEIRNEVVEGKKYESGREEYQDITENSKYGRSLKTYGHVDFLSTKYNKRSFNFETNIV